MDVGQSGKIVYYKMYFLKIKLRKRVFSHPMRRSLQRTSRRWTRAVRLTFDMECSNLAADRVGVDRAAIRATVATAYFTDKQVPLFQIRPHDVEPRVVDDSSLLVCQREGVLVEPRHLQ